jgi:hypothetical protein
MKYAFEMSSGVMIFIPDFIKTGSGIHRHSDSMVISYATFLNKESRQKQETFETYGVM